MSENSTEIPGKIRRSTAGAGKKRKKKNQLPMGIIVLFGIIIIGILLGQKNSKLALYWAFGCCFGFILQKARFCFTASLRDPCITGSTSLTRAVLIAFAITTIGFAAIKYGAYVNGLEIPGQKSIHSISVATAVGGILFGIGMVISGGCASGTLMRVGEGFGMQVLSLFFFIIGSLVGAGQMGWWTDHFIASAPKVFLPDVFGWGGGVIVQLVIIGLLYIAADLFEKKKMGNTE